MVTRQQIRNTKLFKAGESEDVGRSVRNDSLHCELYNLRLSRWRTVKAG